MSKIRVKIGFIGAGSIGTLFGGYLASIKSEKYSIEVILFCREKHAEAINNNGLNLIVGQEIKDIKNIRAFESPDKFLGASLQESEAIFDYLFLTTKTYDSESALAQYKRIIDSCNWLVVLQNGIGNEDIVKEYCLPEKIIRAVTSTGALLEQPGKILHTGKGITKAGFPFIHKSNLVSKRLDDAQKGLNLLTDILNISGLETINVNDIIRESWEKVFVNIGINAFGALTRLKNGQLLQDERLKILMAEAVKEAIKIAGLKNVNLSKSDYIGIMYEVAEKTSENINSMLQDVLKGKKTEIEFINGRIVKYAQELGVNVPINETLTYLIKGLEQSLN
ncbi:MAG: ketopantoate reductase family protein [Promethearchaeota archaeon]